jgi:argininosuccinate lyase
MRIREKRFEGEMDPEAARYISSIEADLRIFQETVLVNMAHVIMLHKRQLLKKREASALLSSLLKLYYKNPAELDLRPELEDIHMVIEEHVIKTTGSEIGGKLHTAKSRNDQVVAAIRMRAKKDVLKTAQSILELVRSLIKKASEHLTTLMPGYTHLQVAEPTTLAHFFAAYGYMFVRDLSRLEEAYRTLDACPMGACALAGTSFQIDRRLVADLLGFSTVTTNTMDAVGSRDWLLQCISTLAIAMSNLSRLAEDLILMSTGEFSFFDMPDEFSSTSSIMPQKKNQVVAELARAKAAVVAGNLASSLALIKALPQSYNLDFQELTPLLWSSLDATAHSFSLIAKMVTGLRAREDRMREALDRGFAIATELANTLVRKHRVPFREAHQIVALLMRNIMKSGKTIHQISLLDLKRAAEAVLKTPIAITQAELDAALDPNVGIRSRAVLGSPSPKLVRLQLSELRSLIKKYEHFITTEMKGIERAQNHLIAQARRLIR